MKSAVISFGLIIVIILSFVATSSLTSESTRKKELDTAINSAAYQSMMVIKDERYEIPTEENFMAEFSRNLLANIDSNSSVKVKLYGLDLEKGFADVEVTEKFKFPNGKEKEITSRKTVLIDQLQKEAENS